MASLYREHTLILGGYADGFSDVHYRGMQNKPWWQRRSVAYRRFCQHHLTGVALVEVHNRPGLLLDLAARHKGGFALHLHNDPQEMKECRLPAQRQRILSACEAIYCVSDHIRQRFCEDILGETGKVHVIYNGLELPPPPPPKQRTILFVGRFTAEKGALPLAEALAKILPRHKGWRAVFVGAEKHRPGGKISPYAANVQNVLQAYAKQVEFIGFSDHATTMRHFAESAIAVVPSIWQEPFGRTALEAMANGCALIATAKGGLPEVYGEAALSVPDATAESLATALEKLMTDDLLRESLQRRGRVQAQTFSIIKTTAALDSVRRLILGG